MITRDEQGQARYLGVYDGLVTDNADPIKRGRVKVKIPGLCEPSTNWALPAGGSHSSGESGRGGFDPPKKGAAVFVQFIRGDIDAPVYLGGWRGLVGGKTDAPTVVQGAPASDAATKLKVYESDAFEVIIDERGEHSQLLLRRKSDKTAIRIRDKGADYPIQVGSEKSAEAFVLGTTWWRNESAKIDDVILALQATSAGCVGYTAALKPGIMQEILAWQNFKLAGAQDAFLSKTAFTEK